MEIERVNDTTIKFFITYKDIEARGFERDEIWYNRERGEELFYEMMHEASNRDDFELDGPLWIQVHALDKGLEIIVTRGQVSDGNVKLEIPVGEGTEEHKDKLSELVDDEGYANTEVEVLEIVIGFQDLEDAIMLSHTVSAEEVKNTLYHFQGRYYLYVYFDNETHSEDEQDNILSRMLEFGYESELSVHRLQEYGKTVMADHALSELKDTFSL
ncbi:adaptor protein MecA [Shouchella shacheensis]|uniref:adaptor protein MecA n=1 Tax=Shouchella shacheensis TaxID=1649580 RepID=UPI00073FC5C1|nr:adaptor protein MecA [Shouchella shacheensis]